MEKLEYTFIRRRIVSTGTSRRTVADAVVAVRFAKQADPDISVDAVTGSDDATCVISISASDSTAINAFDRRIQMACDALGLIFSKREATSAATSTEKSGEPFGFSAWTGQAATSMA